MPLDSPDTIAPQENDVTRAAAPARKSRTSRRRIWAIMFAIAAALLGVMYGVTAHRVDVQDERRANKIQHANRPAPTDNAAGGEVIPGAPTGSKSGG